MKKNITLSELQLIIRDSIYLSLPDFFWVVAEIAEMKENSSGHCYLELIEKQTDEINIKAKLKAIIWNNRYGFVKSFFENTTGASLHAGLKILIKARVEYHELYGLSLVITDINPSFTIGEMAAKRLLIIKKLEDEGVFGMNKELEIPSVPKRIAIISSANAAGYRDFINHLEKNNYGYSFHTKLFESAMQGEQTEQEIIKALCNIELMSDQFDVVAIIRGGGSQTDLGWFDNYNIAFHITQFPLPVITGIGHDKDLSIADLVACKSVKTPTAAADFIIELTAEVENYLLELASNIKSLALESIEQLKERVEFSAKKLMPLVGIIISELKHEISEIRHSFIKITNEHVYKAEIQTEKLKLKLSSAITANIKSYHNQLSTKKSLLKLFTHKLIQKEEKRISTLNDTLEILDPENVLKRGYTITLQNNKILNSYKGVKTDDIIETIFADGLIKSKIMGKNEK